MTAALSAEQRSSLEKLVQGARQWIEEDLEAKLEGSFGINTDGRIEDVGDLTLSNAQASVRRDLVEIVEFLRSEGEDDESSVARLVREAAFTHTNRLIAVRVAEAIGLLPETIANGTASSGFRDFSELAPTVATTEWGRFAEFLRLCADELAADVPTLFDPRNPLLELTMSEPVLAKVVESIAGLSAELWAAPDALGWAYQFFNTDADRRQARYRSDGSPKPPESSLELAVRNQFFTPSYVVEFLVHNGLGAHLAAGLPGFADQLPLLVEVPTERIEVDLEAVTVLDPACGSGHFLLGAYDVLERAWNHAGVGPEDAAPAIVRSLWGIDIDPRAAQIAQAAVMFRARRHNRRGMLPVANVICARALPSGPEIDAFIASLPEHVGRAVKGIADELADAPILGPLLKIEERLEREVGDVFGTGVVDGTLAEGARGTSANVEVAVLNALAAIADSTTSTASQRLFAAEAHDAVRFVEAMSRRYTAVLMNPPFGEPVTSTKDYLKAEYLGAEKDMAFAFVWRGIDLAEEHGSCAAITTRAGFFIQTFERWRANVLLSAGLVALADLGEGVMEQALVESAAFVCKPSQENAQTTFLRLLRDVDKAAAMTETVSRARAGEEDPRRFRIDSDDLGAIPGTPIAYWLPDRIRQLFTDHASVSEFADVKHGLSTGDDFRFVRLRHEVDATRISGPSGLHGQERWVPFAKGGAYAPFWGESDLVLDWQDQGSVLRDAPGSVIRNPTYYFKQGLTWTRRTASKFAPRIFAGGVFSEKGDLIVPREPDQLMPLLGWLNSRTVAALIGAMVAAGDETSSGGAAKSYEMGRVKLLPCPADRFPDDLGTAAEGVLLRRAALDVIDETKSSFTGPWLVGETLAAAAHSRARWLDEIAVECVEIWSDSEKRLEAALGFGPDECAYLSNETWALSAEHSSSPSIQIADRVAELYQLPIEAVISEFLAEGIVRNAIVSLCFTGSRRLEVISHGLGITPRSIAAIASTGSLLPHGLLQDTARDLVSYAVGCCFGRWGPGVEPHRSSPGTMAGVSSGEHQHTGVASAHASDARTHRQASRPGLFLDQPGHALDFETALLGAASGRLGGDTVIQEAIAALMTRPSLRGYLRSQYFGDHISRYTVGRRKSPIYWLLQVPSKVWGVWLYAPMLSREMLFAIVRETEQRQRLAEQQIGHLQREAETGAGGRKTSEVAKELEAEQKLAVELASFRTEAERIANLGWEPDLDDGMVLNAAPLADLFPAWKDAAAYRKELRAGKHEWATVARYADQL